MAERNYPVPEEPVYDPNIRALQNSDEANADTVFNPLLAQLISNIHAVKLLADNKADGDSMQAALQDIANTFDTINTALNGKAASNHTHTAAQVGAAASNHSHSAATTAAAGFMAAADKTKLDGIAAKATANTASTTTPKALGTAAAGSEAGFARGDHVHPKPSAADIGAAAASHNHAAGNITSGILAAAYGGTGNNSGYVRAGQKAGTALGDKATAEGNNTTASGNCAHAEGASSTASGMYSHSEGVGNATDYCAHAEGDHANASGHTSHAENYYTTANGESSHAQGKRTVASGDAAHAAGVLTLASNFGSHAGGKYNKAMNDGASWSNKNGDAFVIGNGTTSTSSTPRENASLSNALRVTYAGAVYGLSAFNTSGADYAEYFEWLDANQDNEDRVGFFVTMEGEKIREANTGDYILGIVSGNPCIIGNADEDWLGRWLHDDFGRFIKIDIETPVTRLETKEVPVLDENGEPTGAVRLETEEVATGEVIHGWDYKANPEYDRSQQYTERKDRPEWSAVGMLGVLSVRDDGSCQVNGFCRCTDGGIATAAEKYIPGQTYRVIARVTENVVKVVFR